MKRLVFAVPLAGAALVLAACSTASTNSDGSAETSTAPKLTHKQVEQSLTWLKQAKPYWPQAGGSLPKEIYPQLDEWCGKMEGDPTSFNLNAMDTKTLNGSYLTDYIGIDNAREVQALGIHIVCPQYDAAVHRDMQVLVAQGARPISYPDITPSYTQAQAPATTAPFAPTPPPDQPTAGSAPAGSSKVQDWKSVYQYLSGGYKSDVPDGKLQAFLEESCARAKRGETYHQIRTWELNTYNMSNAGSAIAIQATHRAYCSDMPTGG